MFNVQSFGAIPDGETDDTSAVRAAISAASSEGGGTVYFPTGTYMVNCILNGSDVGSNITLEGNGDAVIKLLPQSNSPLVQQFGIMVVEGPDKPFTNFLIDGLIFDGNKAVQSQKPMDSGLREKKYYALMRVWKNPALGVAVDHITIQNSIFQNGIAAGMEFEGVDYVTLNNVQLLNNGYIKTMPDGKLQGQADGIYITGSNEVLNDVTARDNADTDITFEGMETWGTAQITNCVISGNSEAGLALANNPFQTVSGREAAHDVTVDKCNIQMTNRNLNMYERGARGIFIYSFGGPEPRNIVIFNSVVSNSDDGIVTVGENIGIYHNKITNTKTGISLVSSNGSGYVIAGNKIANASTGIRIGAAARVTNVTLLNNTYSNVQFEYSNDAGIPAYNVPWVYLGVAAVAVAAVVLWVWAIRDILSAIRGRVRRKSGETPQP